MNRYVYKIFFASGKTYVGQRTFKGDNVLDDKYICSSSYAKNHKQDDPIINRIILKENIDSSEELSRLETFFIKEDKRTNGDNNVNGNNGAYEHGNFYENNFIGVETRKRKGSYNYKNNEEFKRKQSEAHKGMHKGLTMKEITNNPDWCVSPERIKKGLETKSKRTEEQKQNTLNKFRNTLNSKSDAEKEAIRKKQSEAAKGRIPWNKGKKMNKDFCEKVKLSHSNRSEEQKQESLKKYRETMNNKSEKEKEIIKKKLSDALKGKKLSEESKRKISNANKGRKFTKEHCEKISAGKKGHMVSQDTKEKIAKTRELNYAKNKKTMELRKQNYQEYKLLIDPKCTWNSYMMWAKNLGGLCKAIDYIASLNR